MVPPPYLWTIKPPPQCAKTALSLPPLPPPPLRCAQCQPAPVHCLSLQFKPGSVPAVVPRQMTACSTCDQTLLQDLQFHGIRVTQPNPSHSGTGTCKTNSRQRRRVKSRVHVQVHVWYMYIYHYYIITGSSSRSPRGRGRGQRGGGGNSSCQGTAHVYIIRVREMKKEERKKQARSNKQLSKVIQNTQGCTICDLSLSLSLSLCVSFTNG